MTDDRAREINDLKITQSSFCSLQHQRIRLLTITHSHTREFPSINHGTTTRRMGDSCAPHRTARACDRYRSHRCPSGSDIRSRLQRTPPSTCGHRLRRTSSVLGRRRTVHLCLPRPCCTGSFPLPCAAAHRSARIYGRESIDKLDI